MSTFRNPVGPQPTNVYWRRRLLVGLGLVAVIVVILLIVFAPKGATPTATEKTPVDTQGSSSAPTNGTATVQPCEATDLAVVAVTDRDSYSAEELPQLSFEITNTSAVDCQVNAGSDVQIYTITSGSDTIWKSTNCQTESQEATAVLAAGQTTESTPLEWDRTRSVKGECGDEGRTKVTADGATYRLAVQVDGVKSTEDQPFILQ